MMDGPTFDPEGPDAFFLTGIEGLTFNRVKHSYAYNGVSVPSVTTILKPLNDFGFVRGDVLEYARDRGSAVHEAIELLAADDLDEDSLDPVILPYLDGYRRFLADTGFVALASEQMVYHSKFGYAGTFDTIGILNKQRAVIDYKTGASLPISVGPQLAAYQNAYNAGAAKGGAVLARYALHLTGDGGYGLVRYSDAADWPEFLHLLGHFNWIKGRSK